MGLAVQCFPFWKLFNLGSVSSEKGWHGVRWRGDWSQNMVRGLEFIVRAGGSH